MDINKKRSRFLCSGSLWVAEMMPMLQAITEETDYVCEHVDEFEDLMHYPNETYHPLTQKEWQTIQYIA